MNTSFVPSLVALLVVLVLVVASLHLLRRVQNPVSRRSGPLAVHASLALGPRERLVLVEAAGRWLVVGVTASTVSTLAELPEPPVLEQPTQKSFGEMLNAFRGSHAGR